MQMSSEENTFRSGLRLELPYLVDALGKDHGFLHDARQFEFLAEIVADHHHHGSARLSSFLVAGCDRGLDAYSLCITLLEEARERSGLEFSILATDFLPANLDQAKRGVYPSASVRSLSPALVKRYFLRSRDTGKNLVRLRPGVREMVNFRCQDIFDSFSLREPMDVIVCRQVLHHFHPALAQALAGRLRQYLTPGGILVLGARMPRMPGFRHLDHALYQAV
ncbi:chemotaxis protein methyltransferase CheR [Desulfomicrobium macestii]|uniref:Chemotaxis protein methyltransferase CheR n=2 Tax=Desulfomicrobium TaxID=898 RepID=A0A8G2F7Z4_DESNO|nr:MULTISPECIES: CheR family methyltransferase [Desulfomicrobium]MBE1425242.1 chemotaxis protein methyltransferase CheR [Desulfomicrobium macestii]SFL71377.1 chemotaxis protein methyltransferase CheR [Desulfomicrobium norvegicum]